MKNPSNFYIFGEVLFDCFPDGAKVLGGAPFNVAWHLQALGDAPMFISRVGKDAGGDTILQAMLNWGMGIETVQIDPEHPTGRVEVTINNGEPSYDIIENSAFDFISSQQQLQKLQPGGILYHGTLSLRSKMSRRTLDEIRRMHNLRIFLDVNLRPPWYRRDEVLGWLKQAHWAKMNVAELDMLTKTAVNIRGQMAELQDSCTLEQLIVTQGEEDTLIRTADGQFYWLQPEKIEGVVDTVGAGDAFSALYIHGLRCQWPIDVALRHAQDFAGRVIGLRGATTADPHFYKEAAGSLDC